MISKPEAGYVLTNTNVLCGDCVFLREKNKCCYFGPSVSVSADKGSCNRWKGGAADTVPFLEPFWNKPELAYLENSAGFGCRRCEEFKVGQVACKTVAGNIAPYACCDFWEKDSQRGALSNEALVQILAKKPEGLKALAGARRR